MGEEVPDELWEEIFGYVGMDHQRRLAPLSLVCKRFLAISNRARTSLSLPPPAISDDASPLALYSRFSLVKTVHIGYLPHLDSYITQLAQSNLPLQSLHLSSQPHFPRGAMRLLGHTMLKTLKSLKCTRFLEMTDDDLSVVADCFPYLQELDIEGSGRIGHPRFWTWHVTDQGIRAISLRLKSLLSLNVCSQKHLTPRSFHYLSSDCPLICDLHASFSDDCPVGLDYVLTSFKSLSSLQLRHVNISESTLDQLARADLKLSRLVLFDPKRSDDDDISGATLCRFLKSCRPLRHLELIKFGFPADLTAFDFAASIPNIRVIEVISRYHGSPDTWLPEGTLFHLLSSCPYLEEIETAYSFVGTVEDSSDIPVRRSVRKMRFLECYGVYRETLLAISSVCPNLETLHAMRCPGVPREGIEAIMTSCSNIKYLFVERCGKRQNFIFEKEIPY